MSSDWTIRKLGDICEILDSKRKPVTKSDRVAGDIPYYGASGVQDHVADYLFDEPLVLLGEDGAKWHSGDVSAFMISGKSWVNNHAHVLRPMRELVLDEWLTHFLVSSDLSDFITGVTVPKLNQAKMREIEIPLPPLDEQKRIVAKLDQALGYVDEVITDTQSSLNEIDSLWRSALLSHYGHGSTDTADVIGTSVWKAVRFADVIDVYQPTTIATKHLNPNGAHLVYGANGVIGRFDEFNHEQSELLMTCRGATCGALNFSEPFSWINGNAMVVRPSCDELELRFIYYALLGGIDLNDAITGTAQPQITRSSLADLKFSYPSSVEQKRIVQEIDLLTVELDDLKQMKTAVMEEVTNLRSSILAAAFAGDL